MNKLYILFDMMTHLLFSFVRPRGRDRGRAVWGLGKRLVLMALLLITYNESTAQCAIQVDMSPSGAITQAASSPTAHDAFEICRGDDIILTASSPSSPSSTSPQTYQWDPDAANAMTAMTGVLTPSTTTDYTVQELAADGTVICEETVTIVVIEPAAITINSPDLEICLNESTTLTAFAVGSTSFTYAWEDSGSNPVGSTATISVTPGSSGTNPYTVTVTNAAGCTSTETITVIVNPLPVPTLEDDEDSGNASDDGEVCLGADVKLIAGGGVSFVWDADAGNATGSMVTVTPLLGTTNYEVTVTDNNGCTAMTNIDITAVSVPTVLIMNTNDGPASNNNGVICNGSSAELTALPTGGTPGYTYLWDDPTTAATAAVTVSPTTTTTYNVTVTDSKGCTVTDSSPITVNDPVATITAPTATTFCSESVVNFSATGGGTYMWSTTGGSTISPTNGANVSVTLVNSSTIITETFTVTVTDAEGCTATDDIIITVNPKPTATLVEDGGLTMICSGDDLAFTAGGGTSYMWSVVSPPTDPSFSPGTTTATAAPTNTTAANITYTYRVVTMDANGCTDEEMIDIIVRPLPTLTINPMETSGIIDDDATICDGDDIFFNYMGSVTTGPYVYDWTWSDNTATPNSATATSATSTPVFMPTANQVFSVAVTDNDGCTTTAMQNVVVNANPTAVASTTDETICAGETTTISATGGGTYMWDDPTNAPTASVTVTPPATNTFTVTVTNTDGCTATDEVEITVNTPPTITITETDASGVADDRTVCSGESAVLTANPAGGTLPYMYLWSDPAGSTTQMITVMPTVTTTYTVTVTDANGCEGTQDIEIIVPTPSGTITSTETSGTTDNDAIICEGDDITLTVSGGASFQWDAGAGGLTAPTTPVLNPTTTTTYMVTVTDVFGCTVVESQIVTVNPIPQANDVTLRACEIANGDVTFDLTDAESTSGATNISGMDVDNGATVTVTYHMPTGTMNQITPSNSFLLVAGTTFPASVIARIEDVNGCVEESTITLEKASLPTGTMDVTLQTCEDINGDATFNLTDAEDPNGASNITSPSVDVDGDGTASVPTGYTVTYYTPAGILLTSTQAAAYTINSASTVTARITNMDGCFVEQTILLNIASLPEDAPVTLRLCKDNDDIRNFDLTDAEDPDNSNTNNTGVFSNISGVDIDGNGLAGFSNPIASITYHTASPPTTSNMVPNPLAHAAQNGDVITAVITNADGCVRLTSITISIDDPVANPTTLEVCALDAAGNGMFNLTDAEDDQAAANIRGNGGTGIDVDGSITATVTYHTIAPTMLGVPPGGNEIASPTTYSALNGATVVARVHMGDCFSETIVTLTTTAPESNPVTLEACGDGTGIASFNLLDAENSGATSNVNSVDVTNGASGVSVTYHNLTPAAAGNMIPASQVAAFSAPTTASTSATTTIVYALVTRTDGCTSESPITLIKHALPTANDTELTLCEDMTGGGTATFTLTDAETATGSNTGTSGTAIDVDGGSTTNTVAYFTGSGGVGSITGTHSAMDGDVIYAIVTDPSTGCTNEAEIILNVNSNPTVIAVTLEECDDGSGNGVFNLEHAHTVGTSNITGSSVDVGGGNTVDYFTGMQSATGVTQIPNGASAGQTQMYSAANGTTVYALVENSDGCTSEIAVMLTTTIPVGNAVTLRLCDTDIDNTNMVSFDLTDAEDTADMSNADGSATDVDGGANNAVTVTYNTATNGTGTAITAPHPALNGAIVFATVMDNATGCKNEVEITLEIVPLPTANPLMLEVCEDTPGSTMGTFMLTDATNPTAAANITGNGGTGIDVLGGSTTNMVAYFDNTIASGIANPISSPYTAMNGNMIYAVVTDPSTNCVNEVAITLKTVSAPAFNDITLELCNDGTNSGIFNLLDAESTTGISNNTGLTVNNGIAANTVAYYTASPTSGGTMIPTPNIYTANDGDMIVAVITQTNTTTTCTSEATITLRLLAPTATDVTLELCDDSDGTNDNIATFTLADALNSTSASNASGTEVDNGVTGQTVTFHAITPALGTPTITTIPATNGTLVYALLDSMGCKDEATITLNVITPEANDIELVACGTGTVNFDLTAAENASNPSNVSGIAINTPGFNVTYYQNAADLAAGTFITPATIYPAANNATVIALVTDTSGCTNTATLTLQVSNPSIIASTSTSPVCEGDNIVLTSTFTAGASMAMPTYSWTHPNGFTSAVANPTFVAAANSGGTYTVVATDANGCTATNTVSVVVNPAPVVTLMPDMSGICLGDPFDFTFTGTPTPGSVMGDMGTYTGPTGLTTNANGTATLSTMTAGLGMHTVIYTYTDDNGCMASDTSTVVVFDLPTVAPLDTALCMGSTINIDGDPSGGSGTYTNHVWTITNAGGTGATAANLTVANTAIATFDATGLTAGTVTLNYLVTDNNTCTMQGTVDVEIYDTPTASPVSLDSVCIEDQIIIDGLPSGGQAPYTHAWTIINAGTTTASDAINLSGVNTSMVTFDATILTPGTAMLEYTLTDANGCTTMDTVSVVVNPLPAALSFTGTCNADFTMYDAEIQMGPNDTIVSVSSGTLALVGTDVNSLDSFLVSGIPSGTTLSLMLQDTLTGCMATQTITINCNCPTINPPNPISAEFACVGDSSKLIVMVDSTETVDWYDMGGTLVLSGDTSLCVTTAGTYFAVTRDTVTNCPSTDSTAMVFGFHPVPMISVVSDTCDATFGTYSIIVVSDVDSIVADTGMVASVGATMDTFQITGIPIGNNVVLTAVDTATGCSSELTVMPPNCNCPMLAAPMLSSDTTICASDSIPVFTATVGINQTACWLDNTTGDTLALNSITFTPTATGVFAVVAKDTVTNCPSDTARVALVINPLPTLLVLDTICLADLSEYTILFSGAGGTNDTISTTMGIIDSVGIDSFTISQIPDDSTVIITVVDTLTGCMNAVTITNNCSCLIPLIAPVAAMDTVAICPGDSISLMVSVDSTETVDWYDTAGGLLLAGDTIFTIDSAGTYLAVTRDTITACTGTDSTAVVLEIHPLPIANINNNNSLYCEGDNILLSSDTLANVAYDWSTNGSAVISDTAAVAPFFSMVADGEVVKLVVIDTLTGCMAMTTDTLRIDSLPTISGIIVRCGTQQDSFEIEIFTNASTVGSSHGTSTAGTNPHLITGIPRDSIVTLTLGAGNCSLDTIIQPPVFPTVTGSISSPICPGDIVTLMSTSTIADSLLWTTTGAGVFDTLSGPMATITGAVAGDIFIITAIDTLTGCAAIDRDTLEELIAPAAPVIVNQIICKDEPAVFTATLPIGQTINWFDTIVGGTPIFVGPNFTSPETTSGTFTYFAQAVDAAGNGCVSGRTAFTLTILPLPNPNLAPTAAVCPGDSVTLTPGLFNSYFWSTGATTASVNVGPGMYFVTVTDGNGCQAVSAVNVDTLSSQNLTLSIPTTFCTTDAPLTLTGGSPAGGNYIGTGVSGGIFDPAVAGVGTHTIVYALTGSGTCSESVNTQVTVTAPTTTSLALAGTYCTSDASFALTGGSPAGGIYSGVGVSSGTAGEIFDPATAGPGTHVITYTIGTGTSCVSSSTDSIVVQAVPSVSFTPVNMTTLCVQASGFTLGGGSPAGGTFSGTGVTNGVFDPAIAGIGTHTITYAFGSGTCSGSATATYTVTAAPTVGLQLGTTQVCNNAGVVTLTGGTPTGGTYSGTGVTNGVFDPTGLAAGNYAITYNFSAAGSCTGSATANITVAPTGNVSFAVGVNQLCESQGLFTLSSGTPAGGTFSGTGIVGNTFNPATAGAGTHTITYTGPPSTCFATTTANVVVTGATAVAFNMAPPNLCSNSGPVPLTGGSPAGGTYSGTGVTNSSFDPTVAGAGTHTITYATVCGSAVMSFVVRPQLAASLNLPRTTVCSTEGSFALSGGSPASTSGVNGTYSGLGVVNNSFNPASVGPGTYPITYTLNPGFGCTGTATATITVTTPSPSSLTLPTTTFCTTSGAITLSGGSPAGGTYSGNGVSGGVFNPAIAGAGTHTITYGVNGCSNGATATIVVANSQGASFNLSSASICDNAGSFALSGGFPAGGTYSGAGVTNGNVFDPSSVVPGTYTITYTVSDPCAGTTSATANITVGGSNTGTLTLNTAQLCASSSAFVLTGGFPVGGTYSGTGVVGGTTFDPTIAGAGTHTINYNPNDGCSGISTGVVIVDNVPPTPILRMANQICIGEDLLLEATAIPGATSFSWTGPNGFTSFLQNPVIPNVSNLNGGTYNLVVNVGNCASAMSSLNINVNTLPDPVTVSSTGTVCQGSNFDLIVNNPMPGDTYTWFYQTGAFVGTGTNLNLSSTTNPAGRYHVTINRGGCIFDPTLMSNAPSFAFTDVVISAQSAVGAFAGQDATVCSNTFDLNALVPSNANIFGVWSTLNSQISIADPNLSNTPVFNLQPGNNTFIWTLSNAGCLGLSSDTVVVNFARPPVLTDDAFNTFFNTPINVDLLTNDLFTTGFFLDSIYTSGTGSVVINGDQTVSFAPNNTFIGTEQLFYRVCNNFCPNQCTTATATITVGVDTTATLPIPNVFTPNGDGDNDAFIIPGLPEGSELIIYNRWGDEVYRSNNYQNDWFGFWEENNAMLPIGTYFYVLNARMDPNSNVMTQMSGDIYIHRD